MCRRTLMQVSECACSSRPNCAASNIDPMSVSTNARVARVAHGRDASARFGEELSADDSA